jgi:tetratricopeptide (TPR) repeat protein
MGWFSRTFGRSTEAKLERATHFIELKQYNDARLELLDLDVPQAKELLKYCTQELADINLDHAQGRFSAGEYEAAKEHLELARSFGATSEQLKQVRNQGRIYRKEREEKERQTREAKKVERDIGDNFIWGLPDDDPRLRYAMRVERYPEELHKRLILLGTGFAEATLAIEDVSPQAALDMLEPFVEKDPVARFEHMRAALGIGDVHQALADLMIFKEQVGHHIIDGMHTKALLSQLLTQTGQSEQALKELDQEDEDHPAVSMVRAQILESRNQLEEAEEALVALLKKLPKNLNIYKTLARVKVKQNQRPEATNILESALDSCCKTGTCGSQPLDVNLLRMLAQIYLEDREQLPRAKEILRDISRLTQNPSWEDQYLSALAARNEGHPFTQNITKTLLINISESDPCRALVLRAFPQSASVFF